MEVFCKTVETHCDVTTAVTPWSLHTSQKNNIDWKQSYAQTQSNKVSLPHTFHPCTALVDSIKVHVLNLRHLLVTCASYVTRKRFVTNIQAVAPSVCQRRNPSLAQRKSTDHKPHIPTAVSYRHRGRYMAGEAGAGDIYEWAFFGGRGPVVRRFCSTAVQWLNNAFATTGVGRIISRGGEILADFSKRFLGGAKSGEILFIPLETNLFCWNFQNPGGPSASPPSDAHVRNHHPLCFCNLANVPGEA